MVTDDLRVVRHLGYAVARARLFEFAMLKVIEAQRHDLSVPVDERWSEIERWLRFTAGKAAKELHVPEAMVSDLKALLPRRNVVAHNAWTMYIHQREKHGDRAVYGLRHVAR